METTESVTSENFIQPNQHLDWFGMAVVTIGIIGVIGNGFTIYIFKKVKHFKKVVSGMLVINQTAVDLVCSFVLIVTHAYQMRPMVAYTRGLGDILCFLIRGEVLLYSSLTASIYSLLVITLERYLMVAHPIIHRNSFTRGKAAVFCVLLWIPASLSPVFGNVFTTSVTPDGTCVTYNWTNRRGKVIANVVYFMISYIIPLLLFIAAYMRMWWIMQQRKFQVSCIQLGENVAERKIHLKRQMNFTKVMLILVLVFALCWMPVELQALLFTLKIRTAMLVPYKLTLFLSFTNCCINPFIYAYQLKGFKEAFTELLCHKQLKSSTEQLPTQLDTISTQNNLLSSGAQRGRISRY